MIYWITRCFVLFFPVGGAMLLMLSFWQRVLGLDVRFRDAPTFPSFEWFGMSGVVAAMGYWAWYVNWGHGGLNGRVVVGTLLLVFIGSLIAVAVALLAGISTELGQEILGTGFGWTVLSGINLGGVYLRTTRIRRSTEQPLLRSSLSTQSSPPLDNPYSRE